VYLCKSDQRAYAVQYQSDKAAWLSAVFGHQKMERGDYLIGKLEDVSLLHSPLKEVYCIPREEFQTKWDFAETVPRELRVPEDRGCLNHQGYVFFRLRP